MNIVAPVRQTTRLDGWNDIVGSAFTGCAVDADDQNFAGRLGTCQIDGVGFVKIKAQASKVRRWAGNAPSRRSGAALLHLQAVGTGINRQGGCEALIKAGDGVICDPDQKYGIDFITPYEMFVLEVPAPKIVLRQPGFDLERAAGRALDGNRSRLLLAFIQAAWEAAGLPRPGRGMARMREPGRARFSPPGDRPDRRDGGGGKRNAPGGD